MPIVVEEAKLKQAEEQRLAKIAARKHEINTTNRSRLRKLVQRAVSDGQISSKEDSVIEAFANKAKLQPNEVKQIVQTESRQIVRQILSDALEDGILAPDEEEKIARFSKGLGVDLAPSESQSKLMTLSRHAYLLNMREIDEYSTIEAPFKLQSKEQCLAANRLEWNEIAQLKRPQGISLGDDRYLKLIAAGDCYLTTKQVVLDGSFESKKATNRSIQRVNLYRDGVFLSRSSGKSLFLKFLAIDDIEHLRFALTMKRVLTSNPIQGFLPNEDFIPEQIVEATLVEQSENTIKNVAPEGSVHKNSQEPKFTFRVVGDHVGDRSYWINKLRNAENLQFAREPSNPHDQNAVAVCNKSGKQLGYLKREVAAWFARLLDDGKQYSVSVLRVRSDGSLIVAVFD